MNLRKGLKKKKKNKDFLCRICENVSRTESAKELHMKRKQNYKTVQYTPIPTNRKVDYTWFACNSRKVKDPHKKNKFEFHTNTAHASVKKIIPKDTPNQPIQCYNCTECNSTFDARHKLKKRTREQL